MTLPKRHGSTDDYRYGFNGKEKDNELRGENNSYDFGSRNIYDPRVSRFFATDPNMGDFSSRSPYNFAANNPIIFIDKDGENPILGKILFEAISFIRQNVTSEKVAIRQANKNKLTGETREAFLRKVGLYDGVLSAIDIKQQVKDGAADFVESMIEWWDSKPFQNNTFGQKTPSQIERTILGPDGISRKKQVDQIIAIIENYDELPAYTQGQIEGILYANVASIIITKKPNLRAIKLRLKKFNLRFKTSAPVNVKIKAVINDAKNGIIRSNETLTRTEAIQAGKEFVGEGYVVKKFRDGNIKELISADGKRRFRYPQRKRDGRYDANFEQLNEGVDPTVIPGERNPWRNSNNHTNTHVGIKDEG